MFLNANSFCRRVITSFAANNEPYTPGVVHGVAEGFVLGCNKLEAAVSFTVYHREHVIKENITTLTRSFDISKIEHYDKYYRKPAIENIESALRR